MKVWNNLGLLGATALVMGATACNDGGDTSAPPQQIIAPTFEEGQGQDAWQPEIAYPAGPYGWDEGRENLDGTWSPGSVIPDLQWIGYANYLGNVGTANEGLQVVNLRDFYNPTDAEVYPEGSPYGAGKAKPKAIILVMSSVWCGPCNLEAAEEIPAHMLEYGPQGGFYLGLLIDGGTPGNPATVNDLTRWADKYDVDYTLAVDPSQQVMPLFEPAFPGNLIIDTTDMSIVTAVAGVPDDDFYVLFERVLAGEDL